LGNRTEITVAEVLEQALGLSITHSGEIRVVRILKRRLGFTQCRPRDDEDRRYNCYRREIPLAEATNNPPNNSKARKKL